MSNQVSSLLTELSNSLNKLDADTFYDLSCDLLNLRVNEDFILEIDYSTSRLGYNYGSVKPLLNKYKIDQKFLNSFANGLSYLLKRSILNDREGLIQKLKNKKLSPPINDPEKIADLSEKILKKYPDIKLNFFMKVFCKTQYLEHIDWEIVTKTMEPDAYQFEVSDRFSVCIIRLFLNKQFPPSLSDDKIIDHRKEITFELTKNQVDMVINKFSKIRDKMDSLESEKVTKE
jgi:hypothetical protein